MGFGRCDLGLFCPARVCESDEKDTNRSFETISESDEEEDKSFFEQDTEETVDEEEVEEDLSSAHRKKIQALTKDIKITDPAISKIQGYTTLQKINSNGQTDEE